jgi:hypothetical protein
MPVATDDFLLLSWPILAGENSAVGASVPLAPVGFGFHPSPPVVLAADPDWLVRVVRPPAMTVVEEIIPDTDPDVPRTFGEKHAEQANERGSFSFSTYEADAFDIELGDLVEFYDRGLCIGGGCIRASETTKVSKRHEGKPTIEWAGFRPIQVLEDAPVLPARGLGSSAQDRIWGWFSVSYDDSTWIAANEIALVGEGYWWSFYDVVPDLEDRTARWVFARRRVGDPPMDMWAPGGLCLFRQTGTIPANVTEVEVEWGGDVYAEMYFEGESLGTAWYGEGEGTVERKRVSVTPGSQVLVAVATANDDWPVDPTHGPKSHNPGGAVWAVHWIDPGSGQRGGIVMHSDSSAVMLEYVDVRPGVTPGEALLDVLDEVQALGFITWVVPTFTADVDSNGRPWAEVGEIGTKVGYSLWKFLSQLVAVYVDTDLTPGTNEWHAWSKGTRGTGRNVTLAPATTDPETGNLQEHIITRTHARATDVLSFSKFGWQLYSDWTEGTRRTAATVGHGALPSGEAVQRYAAADLAEYHEDRVEHEVTIVPVGDSDKPYWAYGIGDSVTIDGDVQPVVEITWHRDIDGRIHWDQDEES